MKKYRINNFKEQLFFEKLENGLEIYSFPIKHKKNFAAMLVTKYGGRDINFKINDMIYKTPTGIAHFLEHKMFEKNPSPFDFYQKFGTDVNAATGDDYTGYYFIGNNNFEESLRYLLNWIKHFDITDESIIKEQGIILEEKNMYQDNPNRVLYHEIRKNVFKNDPKQNEVIGTEEDIKRITKEELMLCYNTFYKPDNMLLIVTGNINPKDVVKITKKETKDFIKNKNNIDRIYNKEEDEVLKDYEEKKMNVETPKISRAYKINKDIFKNLKITPLELDIYLHMLINISMGSTSEIKNKWKEEELYIDSFYKISEIESHYIIEFYASSNKEDELIKNLEEYLKDLKIDKESFEREKKSWIASEIKSVDNPVNMLYIILDDILDYKEFIPNKIEYIKGLKYETLEKIKSIIKYDNKLTVKILPNNKK